MEELRARDGAGAEARLMTRRHRPRLQSLLRRGVEEDVAREVAFHLEMREQSLRAAGVHAAEARWRAERAFGDVHGITRQCREIAAITDRNQRREDLMEGLREDVRQAWQITLRRPVLSAAIVLVTALAVGGVSAVASLVWGTLWQSLALAGADRVMAIHTADSRFPEHG
ncbi:MAG: permease prefix domain 1-containing protein, partial [Longimicrobiales bacterium]